MQESDPPWDGEGDYAKGDRGNPRRHAPLQESASRSAPPLQDENPCVTARWRERRHVPQRGRIEVIWTLRASL
jgi:hypothetical protein